MKKTVLFFAITLITAGALQSCGGGGSNSDKDSSSLILLDTTLQDTTTRNAPATGMGPNTGVADTNAVAPSGTGGTDTTKQ